MSLQVFLAERFTQWSPRAPEVLNRTKCSITLDWHQLEPFEFLADVLLYRLEKNDKIPPWYVVYSGGRTTKVIDNLAARHPHRFRLKVIVKTEAVQTIADRAVHYYGDETTAYETINRLINIQHTICSDDVRDVSANKRDCDTNEHTTDRQTETEISVTVNDAGDVKYKTPSSAAPQVHRWLESLWSGQTWSSTDTDGTSATCFCMAVRCGYIKQVQCMLDERAELLHILSPTNGLTPLCTAVRKGDINTVRFLLGAGAALDQPTATGQTALHVAALSARLHILCLLIEKGADFQERDVNGLRVEHYAVDSGDLEVLRCIMDSGGDVSVQDNNGWTPLFRALCQGASTAIIEELVVRGSDVELADKAGLPLTSVARIMTNRHGHSRQSVLRLVDQRYPHEVALANFTRLTKKVYSVHSILRLPALNNKRNLNK